MAGAVIRVREVLRGCEWGEARGPSLQWENADVDARVTAQDTKHCLKIQAQRIR